MEKRRGEEGAGGDCGRDGDGGGKERTVGAAGDNVAARS